MLEMFVNLIWYKNKLNKLLDLECNGNIGLNEIIVWKNVNVSVFKYLY